VSEQSPALILQVAVPVPLPAPHFDYYPPADVEAAQLQVGMRVRVPFARREYVGVIVGIESQSNLAAHRIKAALAVLDDMPLLSAAQLVLLKWASRYYHYNLGQVIATALPSTLNQGKAAAVDCAPDAVWTVTAAGRTMDAEQLPKAQQRQGVLLAALQRSALGHTEDTLSLALSNPRRTLLALQRKGWVAQLPAQPTAATQAPLALNAAQELVVETVCEHAQQFYPCLVDGVTGSGKTEVYLQILQQLLVCGKQALVLVPEINLTPQTVVRFRERLPLPLVILHSGLAESARLHAWLAAREGQAAIIIGTRSAVWTPLANLAVIIIDEEHDPAYKQQEKFRYSARDVAVWRAHQAKVPIILGSATPSLESLYNAQQQRYHYFCLPERAGTAVHPSYRLIDMRQQPRHTPFSVPLQQAMQEHIAAGQQVLLFLNRRGYAPTFMCYGCGWIAQCQDCDAHLIYHDFSNELRCHHCGAVQSVPASCPTCQTADLHPVGHGTERLEEQLQALLPDARIVRVDSDTTRQREAMPQLLAQIHAGEADVLLGTQILAKGHHFPNVTLVGVINLDGGLFSVDFRAAERMAQTLVQVAGRAGRAAAPGLVLVQTHHPDHPLLQCLVQHGYNAFTQAALQERTQAQLPPFSRLALLRADALNLELAVQFLDRAKACAEALPQSSEVSFWGPVPAPMTKRGGRFRAQLLIQAEQRSALHHLLAHWLPQLSNQQKRQYAAVRWSLDIDPQDLM